MSLVALNDESYARRSNQHVAADHAIAPAIDHRMFGDVIAYAESTERLVAMMLAIVFAAPERDGLKQ